ncbi:MAG: Fe-S cluster assembly protein IscX [Myxococcales bacterium]|nr:Fe-S cluster assembly protein IscX [Myxococcales bacterium]MCB9552618.1 Fe-S cluster assembly protein IscX [Myxococcales bacterium]
MSLKWKDVHAIGEILYDRFPDKDPLSVRFTDLMRWVLEIEEFDDDPERCGEKVLEAIQMVWLDEWKQDHT